MESLPDAVFQYILSHISNATDVASCNCVSKRWNESTPYLKRLFFSQYLVDNLRIRDSHEAIVSRMVSTVLKLEELVVYCPYSSDRISDWLSMAGPFLKNLELYYCDDEYYHFIKVPFEMDTIMAAPNLESIKLCNVSMIHSPRLNIFDRLKSLELVKVFLVDPAFSGAMEVCPHLTSLLLLGCVGLIESMTIENPNLKLCKLDYTVGANCLLTISSSQLELLEVKGFNGIRVLETRYLKNLYIINFLGRVDTVEFGELAALEKLCIGGVQWRWDAISTLLQMANNVKQLYMTVESTGDSDNLLPFPEVDFVEFFDSHPKLQTFLIHGTMFPALSLKNVNSRFLIPCLEKVFVTVGSPPNTEQMMSGLNSLIKYANNLKEMSIKIFQMDDDDDQDSSDEFVEEIKRFSRENSKIVSLIL